MNATRATWRAIIVCPIVIGAIILALVIAANVPHHHLYGRWHANRARHDCTRSCLLCGWTTTRAADADPQYNKPGCIAFRTYDGDIHDVPYADVAEFMKIDPSAKVLR